MKKEKSCQEEKEGTDVFALEIEEKRKENPWIKISEEEKENWNKKNLLAEKLKAKLRKSKQVIKNI